MNKYNNKQRAVLIIALFLSITIGISSNHITSNYAQSAKENTQMIRQGDATIHTIIWYEQEPYWLGNTNDIYTISPYSNKADNQTE